MGKRSLRVVTLAFVFTFALTNVVAWFQTSPALAEGPNAIVEVPNASGADGCRETDLRRILDDSSLEVSLPFTVSFFGSRFNSLFINENGSVSFGEWFTDDRASSLSAVWPPIMAPFLADVDTRGDETTGEGGEPVTHSGPSLDSFGYGTFAGHPTFCANWVNVGYWRRHYDRLNSFQLLLVGREDVGAGDFDLYFNYGKIQWDHSEGMLPECDFRSQRCGISVRAGYSIGIGAQPSPESRVAQTFEFPGSGVPGAFLDSNTETGLIHKSRGSSQRGRYIFQFRNGVATETPADAVAPVTTASASPTPNPAGWNKQDVTVTISAADEAGGSGVRDIRYSLFGAQSAALLTVPGSTATTTITQEGLTTLSYYATDAAGNAEAPGELTVRLDKTPPTASTSKTASNANGWNNSNVTVRFEAQDALSGFPGDSLKVSFEMTLAGDGAGQSASHTFEDLAGNSLPATVSGINIDRTAPTTTATPTPPANGTGWWTSPVSVALAAADTLSRVSTTTYKLDDGTWATYATPISVAGQGRHVLQYRSTDRADNQEDARTLEVGIDPSAPEVAIRFDPSTMDLAVIGRDDMSGLSAPISFTATEVVGARGDEDNEDGDDDEDDEDDHKTNHTTQDRTYRVADRAGNTLELVVRMKRAGRETEASVRSLRYNGGATLTPPGNELEFEWKLSSSGALKHLEQELEVGKGRTKQEVEATFNAARNSTTIEVERPAPERRVVRTGLALLRLATDRGALTIEFD